MYSVTPKQIEKDRQFRTKSIDPIVEATKSFIGLKNRLPTTGEFDGLNEGGNSELITDIRNLPPEFQDKITTEQWDSNTYAIAVWRGEWNEGYISKNNMYILNDYSWHDGATGLLVMIMIGLVPIVLTILAAKKTARASGSD